MNEIQGTRPDGAITDKVIEELLKPPSTEKEVFEDIGLGHHDPTLPMERVYDFPIDKKGDSIRLEDRSMEILGIPLEEFTKNFSSYVDRYIQLKEKANLSSEEITEFNKLLLAFRSMRQYLSSLETTKNDYLRYQNYIISR